MIPSDLSSKASLPAPEWELAAALRGVRVTFDFHETMVLTDISFGVRRGEIFGVLGPKKSGKSTILKLVAGKITPSAGQIEVFGVTPRRAAVKARSLFLPQDRKPQGFSHAVLTNTLARSPDLVIVDDPFPNPGSVDLGSMKEAIVALRKRGKTVILSSDSLTFAAEVCDRFVILYRGQVEAVGTLGELLRYSDGIRFMAPLLPPEIATRVLDQIRFDLLGKGRGQNEPVEEIRGTLSPPTQERPNLPPLSTLDRLAVAKREQGYTVKNLKPEPLVDAIDHEMLARLIRPDC